MQSTTTSVPTSSTRSTDFRFLRNLPVERKVRIISPETWLISKPIDMLFICGLAPWILGAIAFWITGGQLASTQAGPQQKVLTLFLVTASLIIGESHQFTSLIRYYGPKFRNRKLPSRKDRFPIWCIYFGVALMSLLNGFFPAFLAEILVFPFRVLHLDFVFSLAFSAVMIVAQLAVMFFPLILMQHFCAQAKAVGLKYCHLDQVSFTKQELRGLSLATWVLIIAGVVSIAMPFSVGPAEQVTFFARVAATATLFLCAVHYIARGLMNKGWLPASAVLTWLNMSLFVLLPFQEMIYVWMFVPVFFHATQHWAIAWRTRQDENKTTVHPIEEFCKFVIPIQLLTAVVLFGPVLLGVLTSTKPGGIDATLGLGWSMVVFYLHYFSDRIIWRSAR